MLLFGLLFVGLSSFWGGPALGEESPLVLTTDPVTGRAERKADQTFDLLNEFRFVFAPSEGFETNLAGCDRLIILLESDHQLIRIVYGGRLSEAGILTELTIKCGEASCRFDLQAGAKVELDLLTEEDLVLAKVSQGDDVRSRTFEASLRSEQAELTLILERDPGWEGSCSAVIYEARAGAEWDPSLPPDSSAPDGSQNENSSDPDGASGRADPEQVWAPLHYVLLGLAVAAGVCLGGLGILLIRKKMN